MQNTTKAGIRHILSKTTESSLYCLNNVIITCAISVTSHVPFYINFYPLQMTRCFLLCSFLMYSHSDRILMPELEHQHVMSITLWHSSVFSLLAPQTSTQQNLLTFLKQAKLQKTLNVRLLLRLSLEWCTSNRKLWGARLWINCRMTYKNKSNQSSTSRKTWEASDLRLHWFWWLTFFSAAQYRADDEVPRIS